MRTQHYRAVSHWFTWEDLDFPNSGIEAGITRRAEAAAQAGVELVMIFGFHFRWDFIYCFDAVHQLLKFTVDAYHRHGIKVMDHHSAVLTHRPRNWEGRVHTFLHNHHHVPLTPAPEIVDQLHYAGERLNDWREIRVDDGTPVFVPVYQAENYCTNNPSFRRAYVAYVKRLFEETGIDGLMCDDVGHYGQWASCGCVHCRSRFRQTAGVTLPPATDWNFWGNYENPHFRYWVEQHLTDGKRFLELVRDAIGPGKLLTSCCSSSTSKRGDMSGLDMAIWSGPLNMVMLEMCGNLTGKNSLSTRIPDVLLHRAIAERRDIGCLGLGYAYYPDEGFLTWSFNRFFNSDIWVSTHKTRMGVPYDVQKTLPDEPEIVREAFTYEKKHPELFAVTDVAKLAVYYSFASRSFNGDAAEDYSAGFANVVRALFERNLALTVLDKLPTAADYPYLLLSDCDCLSAAERTALDQYHADGGTLIVTGLLGNRDEHGSRSDTDGGWLERFGVKQQLPEVERGVTAREKYFEMWGCNVERPAVPDCVECVPAARREWQNPVPNLYWTPVRMNRSAHCAMVIELVESLLKPELEICAVPGVNYRMYRAEKGYVVHFLANQMTPIYHETLRFQGRGERIVRHVVYPDLSGTVVIKGKFAAATLHSPDLDAPRAGKLTADAVSFELSGLRRFFSISLVE